MHALAAQNPSLNPTRRSGVTVDMALRVMAGSLILASLALGTWVHPGFFLFTAFVGANLLQSGFSNSCPAMTIFRKLGFRDSSEDTPTGVNGPQSRSGCCGS